MITLNSDSILKINVMSAKNLVGPIIMADNSNVTLSKLNCKDLQNLVYYHNKKSLFEFYNSEIIIDDGFIENL
jgi:hypothetical protein